MTPMKKYIHKSTYICSLNNQIHQVNIFVFWKGRTKIFIYKITIFLKDKCQNILCFFCLKMYVILLFHY